MSISQKPRTVMHPPSGANLEPPIHAISRPGWLQAEFEPALLLATLGAPPLHVGKSIWRQTLVAFCWEAVQLNGGPDAFAGRLPPPWEWPPAEIDTLRRKALRGVDRALAAAHFAMPTLLGHDSVGDRGLGGRLGRAISMMHAETHQRHVSQASAYAMPRARMPADAIDGRDQTRNFLTRVVRPFRSVLHLAAGLALVINEAEVALRQTLRTPGEWEQAGFRTVMRPGEPKPKPHLALPSTALFLHAPLAAAAIRGGQALENTTWRYLTSGRAQLRGLTLTRIPTVDENPANG